MQKRSDSDVVLHRLTLTFGGKDYVVPVLTMLPAADWRKQYFARTKQVTESMPMVFDEKSPDLSKALGHAFTNALLNFPEAIPDLVFAYAPSLDEHKDEILAHAYDQEMSNAFRAIWGVAFEPFLASLGLTLELQRSTGLNSASSDALN